MCKRLAHKDGTLAGSPILASEGEMLRGNSEVREQTSGSLWLQIDLGPGHKV